MVATEQHSFVDNTSNCSHGGMEREHIGWFDADLVSWVGVMRMCNPGKCVYVCASSYKLEFEQKC